MAIATFVMRLSKRTPSHIVFKETADRIGRLYLHRDFVDCDKVTVQIATDKSEMPEGGYKTGMIHHKQTAKKVRYKEDINGKGELGDLYVSKEVLTCLGVEKKAPIEVRISAENGKEGYSDIAAGL